MSGRPDLQVAEPLITGEAISRRVAELGRDIAPHYPDAPTPLLLVGVLKGSTMFFADLLRTFELDVNVDFMSISSYSDQGNQSGVVRIVKDLDTDIAGRDVLVVEDIVDTGLTLTYLRKALLQRRPRSLRTVALLDKKARRLVPVELEFSGFEIPDVFVVGYGLDFQGRYRNLSDVLAVRDLARLANDPLVLAEAVFPPASARSDRPVDAGGC